jgi:hypothetical protein
MVHQHAIDDDDAALAQHVKETGSNMALAICVLPCPDMPVLSEMASHKLIVATPPGLPLIDLGRLRPPPRPPSIA